MEGQRGPEESWCEGFGGLTSFVRLFLEEERSDRVVAVGGRLFAVR